MVLCTGPWSSAAACGTEGAAPESTEVRNTAVDTDPEGPWAPDFTHAGSATRVDTQAAQQHGATSVGDALARVPGIRVVEGNAGLGSVGTKLNVAARGVNPRLSSRTTVLLDDVPIAPAPYGQPQLSLFPVSLFSIARIDVHKGAPSARYGPQTAGGVINLVSAPIPVHPTAWAMVRADRWGDVGLGAAYGGTHRGIGVHAEYAPRIGSSYRDHSELRVHGGLVKLAHDVGRRARSTTTFHYFFERADLPGGLSRDAYDEDPLGSERPLDRFEGYRLGVANRVTATTASGDEPRVTSFFAHTERASLIANGPLGSATTLQHQPHVLDVVGLEPAYRAVHFGARVTNYLDVGVRGMLEAASIMVLVEPVDGQVAERLDLDSSSALQAGALYVEDQLHLLHSRLVLRAGLRTEVVHIEEDSALDPDTLEGTFWAPLPSVSVWGRPIDDLALFAAYGRSFSPPQFLQIGVAPDAAAVEPETADTVEGGIKVREGRAISGEITTWHSAYHDLVDVGLSSYTEVGETRASGVDADLVWAPGPTWSVLEGLAVRGGYGLMTSRIVSGEFEGNQLPWYPRHVMSVGLAYARRRFLADLDVRHVGPQLSDYENSGTEPADGSVGPIDAYTLVDLAAGVRIKSTSGGEVTLTLGVTNLLQEQWISRTDDRNRGILPQRPRTFFGTLSIRHGR